MARVVHFEIHADDLDRAERFYSDAFGWEFTRWEGPQEYRLIRTGAEEEPGIDGGMVRRRGPVDGEAVIAYVCTLDVPSLDEALERVRGLGGSLAVPKMPVPGVGWLAYAKDTEGNVFGMMQADPSAG